MELLKKHWRKILVAIALLAVTGFSVLLVNSSQHRQTAQPTTGQATASQPASSLPPCQTPTATNCDKSRLRRPSASNGSAACHGTGPATITASPIAVGDIAFIQPMGLMIGGHVTPIDHGYFYIRGVFADPPQQAPVYAPLDGVVTGASRTARTGGSSGNYDDYAMTIEATCTFRVRFSNMTGFAGELGDKVGNLQPNQGVTPNYAVKAGELIGYTGLPTAQGIDVWVENDDITLTGFVNQAQYAAAESWKLHMADLFEYTPEPLKSQLLALLERDAEPRWGKIDYDIDGKLVGNWFKEGTGGYGGNQQGGAGYWEGHLAIVYDGNDPNQIEISFGNYQGQAQQFAVVGNQPDPATVDQSTGLVKYELGQIIRYSATTGQQWDGQRYLPHLITKAGPVQGTVLMQLVGQRQLKVEIFPGRTAAQVSGFTDAVLSYER